MPAMSEPRRLVVFLPNWVGDAVMATPALRALRARFASSHIAFAGRAAALEVLSGTDLADASIEDRSKGRAGASGLFSLVGKARRGRFDLAVLLPNSFRAALAARLAGIGRIVGYDRDGRGRLLTDKLPPERLGDGRFKPVPTIDYYMDLVEMLGANPVGREMILAVDPADAARADELLAATTGPDQPVVMVNPGASFGPSKLWDPERFAAVADALIEGRDAAILINAAPAEAQIAADVAAAMRHAPALNFAKRPNTIGLLKALMERCRLLITNDTGARHIAAALGIGVVTLFGSTDPTWAQIDYPLERIVRVDFPCSPCQQPVCPHPAGPAYHQCMAAITPERVLAEAETLLEATVNLSNGARP